MKDLAVVFDCDGTLIDSEDQVIASLAYAIDKVNGPRFGHKEIKGQFGPGADQILLQLLGDQQSAAVAFEFYLMHQKKHVFDMRVYEGIYDLLSMLKNRGVIMGMVTGRHARDLDLVLEAHNLKDYFTVIISDDQLKNSKPSPEGLLMVARQLNISPEQLYYVGDAIGDMETAHQAGANAVAALWDKRVIPEKMWSDDPQLVAKTPREIWDKIIVHNKTKPPENSSLIF